MQVNEKRLLDRLLEMIAIDSVSYEEKPMSDFLETYFKNKGLEVYRDQAGEKFGGNGSNILVHIPGTMEGEAICFNAHQDTVEPGRGIKPVVKDGYLVSSGDTILAADDKAGIATIMEAYDYVKENNIPHREMYFLFTICEELNMMGIKNFDFSKLPTKNIYVIDSAGSPGVMTMKNPAKVGIVATFTGKKAHAGIEPEKGVNACCAMAKAIAGVHFGRIDPETTSNVGRVEGGGQTNVVSDSAFFTAEIRSHSAETLEAEIEKVRKSCEKAAAAFGAQVDVQVSYDYPTKKLDPESFVYKQCYAAYVKEGITPKQIIGGGGGDSNIMAGHGYMACGLACGMTDVHSSKEKLNLAEFAQTVRIVVTLMTE